RAEPIKERAAAESALPPARLTGELARTTGQLRLFANLVEEGSWVDARIDRADPHRKPAPKPDIRRMLAPLGPVAVFGASNFPLAFSVAGGDTASALAAGCPVVIKAHPSHPGTSEIVLSAILAAAQSTAMPNGIISMLHGVDPDISLAIVRHPSIAAVGFTGSLRAGRAIFDTAASRATPIPVYAEMGSINPLFALPAALAARGTQIAEGLTQSVTLGVGQFCTKPGVVVVVDDPSTKTFLAHLSTLLSAAAPGTMLNPSIAKAFSQGRQHRAGMTGITCAPADRSTSGNQAAPTLFQTTGRHFLARPELREELFGPAVLVVVTEDLTEMNRIARELDGQLTATLHADPADTNHAATLSEILRYKAGRLIFNSYPTGVEVGFAMQHGGPYPATTDSRSTSVGTAAISRFARPVAYQDFPQHTLPLELQDANPRRIRRMIDGAFTSDLE
ncbi:MAG TPA: aldehyde dehydrogenase (NADP(+)), partial [Tepidisphaeraceae bacterium]|nr:aldehyde dehydrogenase (NADP(+)) [Tepidisphaeraceae bacterium]